jgi:DNA repair protein RecN (Recombination protein N)
MLTALSVRNIVAIDRLEAALAAPGLIALTGETGAGKSVLLGALTLALGARAAPRLLRPGADKASVTATFAPDAGHPAWAVLADAGIDAPAGDPLLLRRTLAADGRSAAYINDQPTSARLLAAVGATLAEVHGQFAAQELLEPGTHRALLDAYAGAGAGLPALWGAWQAAREALAALEDGAARAAAREADVRAELAALEALAPESGEEGALTARRARLMGAERAAQALAAAGAALEREDDPLAAAAAALARAGDALGPEGAAALDALARAQEAAGEAAALVRDMAAQGDAGPQALEAVDDRLYALRTAARRAGCAVEALPERLERLRADLAALTDGGAALTQALAAADAARAAYVDGARGLHAARAEAAGRLEAAVGAELAPLKLGHARFAVAVEPLADEGRWGPAGADAVRFLVATTPGAPPAPLDKVASGGEAARLMLALRSVLAGCGPAKTLVFDEVDASIGGAVAAAVGARLAALARRHQVLTITHAPQVAARAAQHWRVAKDARGGTTLQALEGPAARGEELARMLAGARVTDEARAAGARLLAEAGGGQE